MKLLARVTRLERRERQLGSCGVCHGRGVPGCGMARSLDGPVSMKGCPRCGKMAEGAALVVVIPAKAGEPADPWALI